MKHMPVLRNVLVFALLAAASFARGQNASAQAEPEIQDNDTSPYHVALINYKTGNYDKALVAIKAAVKDNPSDDIPTDILYARILTELQQYAVAEKWLRSMYAPSPPENLQQDANVVEVELALADLFLREHKFDRAAKYYAIVLKAKPKDPDILLKLVYAKIGTSDLVAAGNYASQLAPMDPKNPYDDHASYYFAHAALAQATGNSQGADDDIQTARTIYGITVTNRYMRTYLQVFASGEKNSEVAPVPILKSDTPK